MEYENARLEDWYRYYYFKNEIDISGSGVEEYTYGQIQQMAGFDFSELNQTSAKDGPSVGAGEIRQVLADRFGTGNPNQVMITNGSNEALQIVIRSILNAEDELIVQAPCYHCHDKIALAMGCAIKYWRYSGEQGDSFNLSSLEKQLTNKTKLLVLNFPHNPTGATISQKNLDDILQLVFQSGAYLLWDAAFQTLTYDSASLRDPILTYDKTISVGTFSKAYGAPGLRFGWFVAPEDIIARGVNQKDYTNLYVSPLVEFVANKMLKDLDIFSIQRLKQSCVNREIVDKWIKYFGDNLSWNKPEGGVCGLVKLPAGIDDYVFCEGLLKTCNVLLVPGSCFSMPGFVRLGFGGNTLKLEEGLRRLDQYIRDIV